MLCNHGWEKQQTQRPKGSKTKTKRVWTKKTNLDQTGYHSKIPDKEIFARSKVKLILSKKFLGTIFTSAPVLD